MSKLTLILNTTTERLAAWLQSAPYENFPTERGRLGLNPPRPTAQDPLRPGRRVIEWPTYYEGKSEAVWTVPPAIRFEVQELATERVQVVAECTQDVVKPYFAGLLLAIAQTWPEATENVNRWLSESGFGPKKPRVPGRPADKQKWIQCWRLTKEQWEKGKTYKQIAEWLQRMHPDLAYSADTLQDIMRAGQAGMLD